PSVPLWPRWPCAGWASRRKPTTGGNTLSAVSAGWGPPFSSSGWSWNGDPSSEPLRRRLGQFLLNLFGLSQMLFDHRLGLLDQRLQLRILGLAMGLLRQVEHRLVDGDFLFDIGPIELGSLGRRLERSHLAGSRGLNRIVTGR